LISAALGPVAQILIAVNCLPVERVLDRS